MGSGGNKNGFGAAPSIPESTLLAVAKKTTQLFEDKEIVFELNVSEGQFEYLEPPVLEPEEELPVANVIEYDDAMMPTEHVRESTPIKEEPIEAEKPKSKKRSPPKYKSDRYYDPGLNEYLEKKYNEDKYPSKDGFRAMEVECGLAANKILYWFSNKRRRDKECIAAASKGRKKKLPGEVKSEVETEEQKQILLAFFEQNPYPSKEEFAKLEQDTGLGEKTIFYWFSNKRRKDKPDGFTSRKIKKDDPESFEPTTVEAGCIGLGQGWRCLQCQYSSHCRQNLFRHFRISHGINAKYCKKCDKIFSKNEYFMHPCLKKKSPSSKNNTSLNVSGLSDIVVPKVFNSDSSCDEKAFKKSFLCSSGSSSSSDDDADVPAFRTPTKADLKSPNKFYSRRYKELLTGLGSKAPKNADIHEAVSYTHLTLPTTPYV